VQVTFTKPGRVGYQYANSERDVKWIESQGWTRVNQPEPAKWVEASAPTRPFKNELVSVELTAPKRGRPRKSQ